MTKTRPLAKPKVQRADPSPTHATRSPGRRNDDEPSAVELAFTSIQNGIRQGQFAPGQRLIEVELTESLGVSRSSLREAFLRLAAEGLVEIIRNRGAVVRQLTRQEVHNLMEIRQALEGLAAKLAAQNIKKDTNRAEFRPVARLWMNDALATELDTFMFENERFHHAIVEASGNSELGALIEKLNLPLFTFQFRSRVTLNDRVGSGKAHRAIAKAILAGDPDAAQSAMVAHIAQTQQMLDDRFVDLFPSGKLRL